MKSIIVLALFLFFSLSLTGCVQKIEEKQKQNEMLEEMPETANITQIQENGVKELQDEETKELQNNLSEVENFLQELEELDSINFEL
jgi:uncharacterized membrane protein required for colicin V production